MSLYTILLQGSTRTEEIEARSAKAAHREAERRYPGRALDSYQIWDKRTDAGRSGVSSGWRDLRR